MRDEIASELLKIARELSAASPAGWKEAEQIADGVVKMKRRLGGLLNRVEKQESAKKVKILRDAYKHLDEFEITIRKYS